MASGVQGRKYGCRGKKGILRGAVVWLQGRGEVWTEGAKGLMVMENLALAGQIEYPNRVVSHPPIRANNTIVIEDMYYFHIF